MYYCYFWSDYLLRFTISRTYKYIISTTCLIVPSWLRGAYGVYLVDMDTVVKSMLEDEEEPPKGLVLFGRDLSQIPCFRESFLYGIASGVGIGLATFVRTSKPMKSQHVGVAGFALTTLVYWSYCRFQWSQKRFDAALMQESLKHKMITEGVEKKLEAKGVLKSA